MSDLNEAGKVETRPDGSKVFTHGHRYPDNTQVVTQEYGPDGKLHSATVKWSGFAGKVLEVTATFDAEGNLVREDGFRAEGMTTPVKALLKPLPVGASAAAEAARLLPQRMPDSSVAEGAADGPVTVPTLIPIPPAPSTPQPATAAPTTTSHTEEHPLADGLKKIYGQQEKRS